MKRSLGFLYPWWPTKSVKAALAQDENVKIDKTLNHYTKILYKYQQC